MSRLDDARRLAESGKPAEAWPAILELLDKDPDEPRALTLASFVLDKEGKAAIAYHIARRLTEKYPRESAGWINLGRCADNLWRMDEALRCYREALKCAKDEEKLTILVNIAAVHLQRGEFEKAREYSGRALKIDPEHLKARHNLGLSQMAANQWRDGWINYRGSLGSSHRIDWRYGEEPEWDGAPDKTVVVFGEQGIGDEICAASMFPDLIGVSKKVVIDCDARLANLFRRSFPAARVYGTRHKKELDWLPEDHQIDASIASMQLGQFFRNEVTDFPRKPYLTADPDRVHMWRALWLAKGKPAIGIARSGGLKETAAHVRRWTLEQLLPMMRAIDAHWVDLEYKNDHGELAAFRKAHPDIDINRYPYATWSRDYDDTAALVAALNAVFAVPTSVAHLAGALGIHTVVTQSVHPCWKFAAGCPFQPLTIVPWSVDKAIEVLRA